MSPLFGSSYWRMPESPSPSQGEGQDGGAIFTIQPPSFSAALSMLRAKPGVHFPVHPFGGAKLCFA